MLTVVWGLGWVVTSIERTAYPRFRRLITTHELHLFFSPTRDELQWAADAKDCNEHLLALLLLKSYRHMGCSAMEDVPEMAVDFVRRAVAYETKPDVETSAPTMRRGYGWRGCDKSEHWAG
ncbi:DUF4158 domain-containing protein [Streptomyces sp. NPDC048442]|uniref:DUF4158 domain-containing protein n=1 Tax=Streptomyces sp. NPDC048442 TaxID=3154823 RepID=UPI00343BB040